MLLLTHILIAFSGLAFTGYTYINPDKAKINISFGFLGATILSGTALMIAFQGGLVRACISGLTISSVMYLGIAAAQRRLADRQASQ